MKNLLLTLIAFTLCHFATAQYCGNSGTQQCTPIGSTATFGSFPMYASLPCIEANVPYDNSAQFVIMNTLNFQGLQQVDSIEIVSIGNLPCGLCWSTNKPTNRFAAYEDGCLRITGNTAYAPGQYELAVAFKMWINNTPTSLTVPASLAKQMDIKLYIIVKLAGTTCASVDSTFGANSLDGTCGIGGNPPVADFVWAYMPYVPGNLVHFADASTNNPTSWVWSFGDGSGSTLQNPSKNYLTLDTFTVCLTASNAAGTSQQVCKQLIANGTTALTTHNAADTICANSHIVIDPLVFGGLRPYTYYWSGTGNTLSCTTCKNPEFTITQNSEYALTVIDANNNTVTATHSYQVNQGTNNMQVSATAAPVDCLHPTDTTTLTINGGTAPYRIAWGDQIFDTTNTTTALHSYLYQQGNFVIKVTDNNNCISAVANSFAFNGIDITAAQTTLPQCQNDSTGKLKINATGGTAPYTYLWNNGSTADSITGVSAGNYRVTVTDATACSFAKTLNLAPANGWGYVAYTEPAISNCNNNGSITTTVFGGNAPFSFQWSNGTATANINGLAAGVYYLTVTDATGCEATALAWVPTSCYNLITGTVFNDGNNNCIYDVSETGIQHIVVTATGGGQTYYGYADTAGNYTIQIPTAGSFTIGTYTGYGSCGNLTLCNNTSHTVTLPGIGDTSANNNFGFTGIASYDLGIHPGWTNGNPGFEKNYWIYFGNNSYTAYNGTATITFNYDENLTYQSSTPLAQHNLATHTLTWQVNSIGTSQLFFAQQIQCSFMVPQTLPLGHLLHTNFRIEPTTGDCDSSNNNLAVTEVVTGSYDPNEKKVQPAGDILEEDSVLTYEIGFQNTGTDSTHFIILKDTLSAYLDPATVRNIASSHPYSDFSISGTGILTWAFKPLRLVDSFTNEPGSHGFVKFTVKKKANLPLNTQISNTAHIYFDYNPAVVTNTVANRLTEPTGIWHIRANEDIKVKAFPNPFSDGTNIAVEGLTGRYNFELYDITGKLKNRIPSIETSQFYINRDNLSAGIYFFKISSADKKKSGYGKLVVE